MEMKNINKTYDENTYTLLVSGSVPDNPKLSLRKHAHRVDFKEINRHPFKHTPKLR